MQLRRIEASAAAREFAQGLRSAPALRRRAFGAEGENQTRHGRPASWAQTFGASGKQYKTHA